MKKKKILLSILIQAVVLLLLLLSFSLGWCMNNFGNISMDEIVFTLNMPLKGTANKYFFTYFMFAFLPAAVFFVIELFFCFFPKNKSWFLDLYYKEKSTRITLLPIRLNMPVWLLIFVIWTGELISIADENFEVFAYVKSQVQASEFIENEYVKTGEINITFPEKKQNLILIYIESAETSFQDVANGGLMEYNIIPEMTQLAKENTSFSQSELLEGAAVAPACGWTIAGLVAETSGLPLKLFQYDETGAVGNSMDRYESFMPGAVCLGDILEREGYHNYFIAGSNFDFAGRRNYFTQHGNYEVWDLVSAKEEGKLPADYELGFTGVWGFNDEKLYSFAKEKLPEIAKTGEPFSFSMLTIDTHTGGGFQCELCPDTFPTQYENTWGCASKQLYDFVEWVKEQDFYENTTICVTGDHCSMEAAFLAEHPYNRFTGATERKVYNVFINPVKEPVNMKNRKFTTMDMFPTILGAIGADIDGNRLSLGTNLFSDRQTLAEEYGYETMFDELNKKSRFYDNEILYPDN